MTAIISVIGNSGAGKTTLAYSISNRLGCQLAKEEHQTRPFQALMALDEQRYACLNQVDYLLFRAEQEQDLRSSGKIGILDGGLEEDFYLFTRLFHQRDYLNDAEFKLCSRLYNQLRESLPPVDLFIWMDTPVDVCIQRYQKRGRTLEIARTHDLESLDILLKTWIDEKHPQPILRLDGSQPVDTLLDQVKNSLYQAHILS